ncbi:MAG: hypothetical protein K6G10_02660 [Butyrivibrio sp.]|nr:hypothetical protein [Butyrivibrio sp.]
MDKKEMIKRLSENQGSVLSFPDRGPWGSSKYRGNCSGWVIAQLLNTYNVQRLSEIFAGSGTGADVCADWGCDYIGADLNPNPVRKNIISLDVLKEDIPTGFLDGSDMWFGHPPYSELIKIPYANSMWKDTTKEHNLDKSDLGQMNWDDFIKALNVCVMKMYAAQEKGSRGAILMGDIRRGGRYYSMLNDIVKPGACEGIWIKRQHNYSSMGKSYAGQRNYLYIEHEYVLIFKKLASLIIDFMLPVKRETDIRDSMMGTWNDCLNAVMTELKEAHLSEIYEQFEGSKKAERNENWKAKVRQTLQLSPRFVSKGDGVWALAA